MGVVEERDDRREPFRSRRGDDRQEPNSPPSETPGRGSVAEGRGPEAEIRGPSDDDVEEHVFEHIISMLDDGRCLVRYVTSEAGRRDSLETSERDVSEAYVSLIKYISEI